MLYPLSKNADIKVKILIQTLENISESKYMFNIFYNIK